jgi:putative intracellular protease/amidase
MQAHRILFVVTSADRMGNAPDPTGSWLEEIAAPYYAFRDAKCAITLASPKGGAAPIDPKSNEAENQTASTRRFEADAQAVVALANTATLSQLDLADYDAVFFAGGHGTMEDFPTDASVRATVEAFYAAGKPLASVCHGPACLVNARNPNGEALIKGHRFTCFSDEEETAIGLEKIVPFMLESRLTALGGSATTSPAFQACVITDRHLITGQNPASAIPVAESVIHFLRNAKNTRSAA